MFIKIWYRKKIVIEWKSVWKNVKIVENVWFDVGL